MTETNDQTVSVASLLRQTLERSAPPPSAAEIAEDRYALLAWMLEANVEDPESPQNAADQRGSTSELPMTPETLVGRAAEFGGARRGSRDSRRWSTSGPQVAAFEDFYRRFFPVLTGSLLLRGAGVNAAVDLAQDTMLRVWQHWAEINDPEMWALNVARRSLYKHAMGEKENITDPASPSVILGDEAAEFSEATFSLLSIAQDLPSRQRQVLLGVLEERTVDEIAVKLKLTPQAVRGSLRKARHRITEQFSDQADKDAK